MAQGTAYAFTADDLPAALWDGVMETAEQAAEMAGDANAERRFQRERLKTQQGQMW